MHFILEKLQLKFILCSFNTKLPIGNYYMCLRKLNMEENDLYKTRISVEEK